MSDNNFEATLSSLFANEELMSKISEIAKQNKDGDISSALPQVMSILSSSKENGTDAENKTQGTSKTAETGEEKEVISESVEAGKFSDDTFPKKALESFGKSISKNSQLLRALKPYLSHERAEMIDNIIRISQIADIMKFAK